MNTTIAGPGPPAAGLAGVDGRPPITSVRVLYPDLHGVARGKDVPICEFDHVVEQGLCFCAAVMGTDLRHTPVVGRRAGLPRPDRPPRPRHDADAALGAGRGLLPVRPRAGRRAARRSATRAGRCAGRRDACARSDLEPIVGPELEFFLVVRDPAAPNGIRRHVDHLSMVYTVGPQADPGGLVRKMTEDLSDARARGVRGQPRVHELPVRDQPAPLRRPECRRPRLPPQDRGQGHRRPERPRRHVHGQAVQRPGRLGHAPAHLAQSRRRQRVRRP